MLRRFVVGVLVRQRSAGQAVTPQEARAATRDISDNVVKGLRLHVTGSSKSWQLRYTINGTRRIYTIGPFPTVSLKSARELATDLVVEIRKGRDPAAERIAKRGELTVDGLVLEVIDRHWGAHAKPSYVRSVEQLRRTMIRRIGDVRLSELTRRRVLEWHQRCGEKAPIAANRALAVLSKACALAVQWDLLRDNPCRGISRYRENKKERFLSDDEYAAVFTAIEAAQATEDPWILSALTFALLTGWRRGEIAGLRWDELDLPNQVARLKETKTGAKVLPLGADAIRLLRDLPRLGAFVFPRKRAANADVHERIDAPLHPSTLTHAWSRIRKDAGVNDVRLHDLRHSFASVGARSGLSLIVIGRLLGHSSTQTTARYAHLAQPEQIAAAELIGRGIAGTRSRLRPSEDE